jgi:hypothetical protein
MSYPINVFSKKYNEYFSTQYIIKVYYLYLAYCEKHCVSPNYLENEFNAMLNSEIPDEFVTQLLYHSELENSGFI